MLEKELEFFGSKLSEWLKTNPDRVALIKGDQLVGFYDTEDAAFKDGVEKFGLSPFLVRRVTTVEPQFRAPAYCLGLLRAVP